MCFFFAMPFSTNKAFNTSLSATTATTAATSGATSTRLHGGRHQRALPSAHVQRAGRARRRDRHRHEEQRRAAQTAPAHHRRPALRRLHRQTRQRAPQGDHFNHDDDYDHHHRHHQHQRIEKRRRITAHPALDQEDLVVVRRAGRSQLGSAFVAGHKQQPIYVDHSNILLGGQRRVDTLQLQVVPAHAARLGGARRAVQRDAQRDRRAHPYGLGLLLVFVLFVVVVNVAVAHSERKPHGRRAGGHAGRDERRHRVSTLEQQQHEQQQRQRPGRDAHCGERDDEQRQAEEAAQVKVKVKVDIVALVVVVVVVVEHALVGIGRLLVGHLVEHSDHVVRQSAQQLVVTKPSPSSSAASCAIPRGLQRRIRERGDADALVPRLVRAQQAACRGERLQVRRGRPQRSTRRQMCRATTATAAAAAAAAEGYKCATRVERLAGTTACQVRAARRQTARTGPDAAHSSVQRPDERERHQATFKRTHIDKRVGSQAQQSARRRRQVRQPHAQSSQADVQLAAQQLVVIARTTTATSSHLIAVDVLHRQLGRRRRRRFLCCQQKVSNKQCAHKWQQQQQQQQQ